MLTRCSPPFPGHPRCRSPGHEPQGLTREVEIRLQKQDSKAEAGSRHRKQNPGWGKAAEEEKGGGTAGLGRSSTGTSWLLCPASRCKAPQELSKGPSPSASSRVKALALGTLFKQPGKGRRLRGWGCPAAKPCPPAVPDRVTDGLYPLHLLLQPGVLLHQPLESRGSILPRAPAGVVDAVGASPFHACQSAAHLLAGHPCGDEHSVTSPHPTGPWSPPRRARRAPGEGVSP